MYSLFNDVRLIGKILKDADIRYTSDGRPYLKFVMRISDYHDNPVDGLDGVWKNTLYMPIYSFYKKTMEYFYTICKKDMFIILNGRIASGFRREKVDKESLVYRGKLYISVHAENIRIIDPDLYDLKSIGEITGGMKERLDATMMLSDYDLTYDELKRSAITTLPWEDSDEDNRCVEEDREIFKKQRTQVREGNSDTDEGTGLSEVQDQ